MTKTQYERLLALAEQEQKPLSVIIREGWSSDTSCKSTNKSVKRRWTRCWRSMVPVRYHQMEAEIEQGALDG
ncbi:MAG: hypothetical protein R2838_09780 [Caldilineaceae bacterium]